jgi:RNA polymerase sigma-70 factor (ECF subfamily)
MADEAGRAAERVARESYGRLVAVLAARTRDLAGAEDALSEAFAAALRTWPVNGVPDNPVAWLLTVARRRRVAETHRCRCTRAQARDDSVCDDSSRAVLRTRTTRTWVDDRSGSMTLDH